MKISIIKIGNSKGFRLSKTILNKYDIKEEIELILEEDQIILKPVKSTRANWESKYKKMSEENEDEFLIDDVFNDDDFEEWN